MFMRLGRIVYRRRRLVLAGTVVFLIVAAVTGFSVFDKLKSGGFEDPAAEAARAKVILGDRFDAGSPDLVLLASADGGVNAPGAAQWARAGQEPGG